MSKFSFRMSDTIRQMIKDDAERQYRSESYIVNQILESHYDVDQDAALIAPGLKNEKVVTSDRIKPSGRADFFRNIQPQKKPL